MICQTCTWEQNVRRKYGDSCKRRDNDWFIRLSLENKWEGSTIVTLCTVDCQKSHEYAICFLLKIQMNLFMILIKRNKFVICQRKITNYLLHSFRVKQPIHHWFALNNLNYLRYVQLYHCGFRQHSDIFPTGFIQEG